MGRNLVRSEYHAGDVAWLDWLVETILLLIGLWAILLAGNATIGALALAAAFGFGFLLVVAEMGTLGES